MYYLDNGIVEICNNPEHSCPHTHYYFLESAVDLLLENYYRTYHLDEFGEVELCQGKNSCSRSSHFQKCKEAVYEHRANYDFSGDYTHKVNPYVSFLEEEFVGIVRNFGYRMILNSQEIISPWELDVFLPDINIAFEVNGSFWHSDKEVKKRYGVSSYTYHKNKYDKCLEQGILLGQIWEQDWRNDWRTVVSACCDLIQFRRHNRILESFDKPVSPQVFHEARIDYRLVREQRKNVEKRYRKKHSL